MADVEQKVPTWGYHAIEPAKIFHLKAGEKLPAGWSDAPVPQEAPAEDQAAESDGNPRLEAAVRRIGELEGIIQTGMTENAGLVKDLKEAEDEADVAAAEVKRLTDENEALKAQNAQLQADLEAARAGAAPAKARK